MQGVPNNGQMVGALVLICMTLIVVVTLGGCLRPVFVLLREVRLWFHNLPFYYGWRVQKWVLGKLGLTRCPSCHQWVELSHHPRTRCPVYVHERLSDVEGLRDNHNDRLHSLNNRWNEMSDALGQLNTRRGHDLNLIGDRCKRLETRVESIDEDTIGRSEWVEMLKVMSDKMRGVTTCTDTLLTRSRAQEQSIKGQTQSIAQLRQDIAPLHEKVKRLEEFSQMDLSDIRILKEKVNHIIPEVLS
jgi:archaellum component FlaC